MAPQAPQGGNCAVKSEYMAYKLNNYGKSVTYCNQEVSGVMEVELAAKQLSSFNDSYAWGLFRPPHNLDS